MAGPISGSMDQAAQGNGSGAGPPAHNLRSSFTSREGSEVTVKGHVGRIFTKLDLRDRAAAIVYAFDRGLVSPGG